MSVTLRLFHQDDPFRQIEARTLDEGEVSIGRDTDVDWPIADPDRELSRTHCTLSLRQGLLTLRDVSANGVLVGPGRVPAPKNEALPIEPGAVLRLGSFMVVAEPQREAGASGFDAPFNRPILEPVAVDRDALLSPSDWPMDEAGEARPNADLSADGILLDAFCAGARLDPSAFAGEDPAEVMRRLGAVYQQMVLGLTDLMSTRATVKAEYRMSRTSIGPDGNNPFRWAPAHRVASDLLRDRQDGFLSGPEAVKASFADMKKHLLCMLSGTRAAVGATLEGLSPEAVEQDAKAGLFSGQAAANWRRFVALHESFSGQAAADADSAVNRAFRNAYEHELQALDGLVRP